MKRNIIIFLILFILLLQQIPTVPIPQPNPDINHIEMIPEHTNQINQKMETTNYKLEAYPIKTEYTLGENIQIVILLYNQVTGVYKSDTVLVTMPLGTRTEQLANYVTTITLDKGDFLTGINTIQVNYNDQIVSFEILRRIPILQGLTQTTIEIHDVLNTQPAPGVPEYINYTVTNPTYNQFPTETNEYVQVSIQEKGVNLVLVNELFTENDFILHKQMNFTIPLELPVGTGVNMVVSYSGDSVLQPSTSAIPFVISTYNPIVSVSMDNSIIGMTNILNDTDIYMNVKIEGYLQAGLSATVTLSNTIQTFTLLTKELTDYREKIPIAIVNTLQPGIYVLQINIWNTTNPSIYCKAFNQISVVNKIELIVRTNTTIFTVGVPIMFDFFSYDPRTFIGVTSQIIMEENGTTMLNVSASGGHVQKVLQFNSIDTSYIHTYTFLVQPATSSGLYSNIIEYKAKFYHNTTIEVIMPTNIVETKQLVSFKADTAGTFIVVNNEQFVLATVQYTLVGGYTNYYIVFNNTFRGINVLTVKFFPTEPNYSNVTEQLYVYVYDKIVIQNVQTNASFYQLGSYILLQGVASIPNVADSLNGVRVSLLLNNIIIANTTIDTNGFTFIVPTPNATGLMDYKIAIFADNLEFIVTSDLYELTLSVINNFGLLFTNKEYTVGDTIQIGVYGLENRNYKLYYTIDNKSVIIKEFTYTGTINVSVRLENYGHYLIYLEEESTNGVSYYAIDVLQNPSVSLINGALKTYTNNIIWINFQNYIGSVELKIDGLSPLHSIYTIQENQTINQSILAYRAGNHSITIVFDNEYTMNRVRTYYFIIYQKVEIDSISYSPNGTLAEEDSVSVHVKFKEYDNVSTNAIPVEIITNNDTILAQANVFNSEADFQLTIIGTNLSLVIQANQQQFIPEEQIPLNLTIDKILTSDMQSKYSFDAIANLTIKFAYKYYPTTQPFTITYQLLKDGKEIDSKDLIGQKISIVLTENGNYNLTTQVSCQNCMNRTFITTLTMQKFLDVSNTTLVVVVVLAALVPVSILTFFLLEKHKKL